MCAGDAALCQITLTSFYDSECAKIDFSRTLLRPRLDRVSFSAAKVQVPLVPIFTFFSIWLIRVCVLGYNL